MSLLEVRGVTKAFGQLVAVSDVSLSVPSGELRAVIGPNGAGKTTLFNCVSGVVPPDSGTVRFDGHEIAGARLRLDHCRALPGTPFPFVVAERELGRDGDRR